MALYSGTNTNTSMVCSFIKIYKSTLLVLLSVLQHGSVTEACHSIIIGCQVHVYTEMKKVLTETSEISLIGSCWMNVLGICLTVIAAAAVIATAIKSWGF